MIRNESGLSKPAVTEDGIDVIHILLIVWSYKYWIMAGTAAFTIWGVVRALTAAPTYHSEATLSLKEEGGGGASSMLSQLGGLGGMVATNLGLGNTNLDKIEIILKGQELAEAVINRNNLIPAFYPSLWDSARADWIHKDSTKIPTLRKAIEVLRIRHLAVNLDAKRKLIKVGITLHDSVLAKQVVEFYLAELNNKIRNDVIADSEKNRAFLETQMNHTSDPILIEKINNMIAFEIEKVMLVSSNSVQILEKPMVPMERSGPKRKKMVVLSFLMGLIVSTIGAFVWKGLIWLKLSIVHSGIVPVNKIKV